MEFGDITFQKDEIGFRGDLHRLNISKNRGADGLPQSFYGQQKQITRSLKLLYWNIKRLFKLPNAWKEGFVSPIHEENERVNVKNYGPVTLLGIISKTFDFVSYFVPSHLFFELR